MINDTNDGRHAFPKTGNYHDGQVSSHDSYDQCGMSLRDYFAAHALAGIVRDPAAANMSSRDVAMASYAYADAMLKARAE
jgi:hypothetical protein